MVLFLHLLGLPDTLLHLHPASSVRGLLSFTPPFHLSSLGAHSVPPGLQIPSVSTKPSPSSIFSLECHGFSLPSSSEFLPLLRGSVVVRY